MTTRAAGILYAYQGLVLLLKRAPLSDNGDTWAFPGGGIEPGETAEQAAIRESSEEIGYIPNTPLQFLNDNGQFVTYKISGEYFTPVLNSEHTAYIWADVADLPQPLHPGVRELIGVAMTTKRVTDSNGWYEVRDNPISKVGVFPYSGRAIGAPEPDRMYNVYRPEEELNNPDTIRSFQLLPFIDDHPADLLGSADADLPTVDGKPAEGVIGERVYFRADTLFGNLKVFTDRVAKAIDAGKRELSAGFRCLYEKSAGTYNGQSYEYIQRNIRGNHVALVNQGRMGPAVAVLDHLKLTYDAKELIKMDTKEKESVPAKDAEPEMSLADLVAMVKAIAPQVKALTDAMATLTPGAAAPVADVDPAATPADTEAATVVDADPAAAPVGMDAMEKRLATLEADNKALRAAQGKALDSKQVFAAAAARDTLYRGVSAVVGAFDASEMDAADVAKYAVGKIGLKNVPAGAEIVAVEAYLAAKPGKVVAMDSKQSGVDSPIRQHVSA